MNVKIGSTVRFNGEGGMPSEMIGRIGTIEKFHAADPANSVLPAATVRHLGGMSMVGLYQLDAHFDGYLPLNADGCFRGEGD